MKRLNENYIRMARELEKSKGTFEPKSIWFRAWELMIECHYLYNET